MYKEREKSRKLRILNQGRSEINRILNPEDFNIAYGYSIELYAQGLDIPIGMAFSEEGDLYIAESGSVSNNARILRYQDGRFEIEAEGLAAPITGITYYENGIYISHKGYLTLLKHNRPRVTILSGLPCGGDFSTSKVAIGPDGKLYFGQGAVTNAGVVGLDNQWVHNCPLLHDEPPFDIVLAGQNFKTNNVFSLGREIVETGAFSSFGVTNIPAEIRKGVTKATGCILKVSRDGTEMEQVATGLRNPVSIKFDKDFRLLAANRGYDVRGSRPIANSPDEFYIINKGTWYGWPDYTAGEPLTLEKYKPEGQRQPEFLLAYHPSVPPKPYVTFLPHSTISGFDINYQESFGAYGDVFIAETGSYGPITMGAEAPYEGIGNKISRINMKTREVSTFINNKSGKKVYTTGGGGFGSPVDIAFGPDGVMYVLDIGISDRRYLNQYIPNTGVIWRVVRTTN